MIKKEEHLINEFVSKILWKVISSKDNYNLKLEKIVEEISKFFVWKNAH